jgi:hypothetical protein
MSDISDVNSDKMIFEEFRGQVDTFETFVWNRPPEDLSRQLSLVAGCKTIGGRNVFRLRFLAECPILRA